MEPAPPKLSLVAQFDDLCRQLRDDTQEEELFLDFVQNQETCRQRWHTAELENAELRRQVAALQEDKTELSRKLAHAKDVLEKEVLRREKCERELLSKQHQLQQIREFMMNSTDRREETLTFLKEVEDDHARKLQTIDESIGSVLSPSDASDEEDCCRSSRGKRRSSRARHLVELASPQRKRKKSKGGQVEDGDGGCAASVVATTTVTVTGGKELVATSRVYTSQPHPMPGRSAPPKPPRKSVQTPSQTLASETLAETPSPTPKFSSESAPSTPVCQRRSYSSSPSESTPWTPVRRTNSAGKLMSKQHVFVTKTMTKAQTCGPCGKKVVFYRSALKCVSCRSVCHHECRDKVPLPCVPVSKTPTLARAARRGTIADYAPATSPMVPALVVHCIQEVERRGLSEAGLYRVSGGEQEVQELRAQFQRGKGIPNLSKVDIHVVCSVLREFLSSLTETLITKSLWDVFAKATELPSGDRTCGLWHAVSDLPPVNRDTLAAMVVHLQVVANSAEAMMPLETLARMFAPTLVGYSSTHVASVADLQGETRTQERVMQALLDLPADYWQQILNGGDSDDEGATGTPELKKTPGPRSKLFGPIYSSGGTGSSGKKTSWRASKSAAPGSKRRPFFSPTLK